MSDTDEKDLRWLSLALIPVPAEPRNAVDLPTAYVPPSDSGGIARPRFAPSYRWSRP
jgi:hypothetical protein